MEKGTYTLILSLKKPLKKEVGSLGPIEFKKGFYAYTGSAFGPGGFSRVERHRELSRSGEGKRHWHIDYLLEEPSVELKKDFRVKNRDLECCISKLLVGKWVENFGCTDCDCDSHLTFNQNKSLIDSAETLYRMVRRNKES